MPDYPVRLTNVGALPRLSDALADLTWLARYFDALEVASRHSIHEYGAAFLRILDVLDAPPQVVKGLRRIISLQLRKRRGYVLRPVRLAETVSWLTVLRCVLTWDQRAHGRERPGTREWALTLRDRVMLWILLFVGPRIENLVSLKVAGPGANLTRDETGRIQALILRESETKNNRRVVAPIGRIRGVAELVQRLADEAQPLIGGRNATTISDLFLRSDGTLFDRHSFRRYFKRRLRPEVFGPHDVYVHYLRRICVAVLRNGYDLDFTTIGAILGHTEDTARRVYYVLTPSAAAARYAAALSGEAPREPGVEAVMGELKGWLDHVARDLGR
jgi:integrase